LDLNKLFVEPRHIRGGVGRALPAHAVAEARPRGAERLTILADPNAAGFYERKRCGADRGALGRCARPPAAARSDTRSSQWEMAPARDSLIRRIDSLMARFNSLLGRNKFPVPMRRELRRKPLNLALDCQPIGAL